jgi:hypothetical protein
MIKRVSFCQPTHTPWGRLPLTDLVAKGPDEITMHTTVNGIALSCIVIVVDGTKLVVPMTNVAGIEID